MPVSGHVLAAIAILCVTSLVALFMVLRFAKTMVDLNHGDTKCLRDVAVLFRALRGAPGGLLTMLDRVISRR